MKEKIKTLTIAFFICVIYTLSLLLGQNTFSQTTQLEDMKQELQEAKATIEIINLSK